MVVPEPVDEASEVAAASEVASASEVAAVDAAAAEAAAADAAAVEAAIAESGLAAKKAAIAATAAAHPCSDEDLIIFLLSALFAKDSQDVFCADTERMKALRRRLPEAYFYRCTVDGTVNRGSTSRVGDLALQNAAMRWMARHGMGDLAEELAKEQVVGVFGDESVVCATFSSFKSVLHIIETFDSEEDRDGLLLSDCNIVAIDGILAYDVGVGLNLDDNLLTKMPKNVVFGGSEFGELSIARNHIAGPIKISDLFTDQEVVTDGHLVLNLNENKITEVVDFGDVAKTIRLSHNPIRRIATIPNSVVRLELAYTELSELPELPETLRSLDINNCKFSALPRLPQSIESLNCCHNLIEDLGPLPPKLMHLHCSHNLIEDLGPLPSRLFTLVAKHNKLRALTVVGGFGRVSGDDLAGNPWDPSFVAALGGKKPEEFDDMEELADAVKRAGGRRLVKAAR
jgi:hypothetical protein